MEKDNNQENTNIDQEKPPHIIQNISAENVSVLQHTAQGDIYGKDHDSGIKAKEKAKYLEKLMDEKEELYHQFKKEYDKILDLKDKELVDLRKENQSLRDAVEFFQKELKDIYNG